MGFAGAFSGVLYGFLRVSSGLFSIVKFGALAN